MRHRGEWSPWTIVPALPQLPGRNTFGSQVVQLLFLLERIHALPETIVCIAHQVLSFAISLRNGSCTSSSPSFM